MLKRKELFIPDLKNPFEIETNASYTGIGGVLRQYNKPGAYF
jgi:hypothetical protein